MYIPQSVLTAQLIIYDLKGAKVNSFIITEREHCAFTLKSSNINSGTYFYTLILDNNELESKILIKID
ncbi:MAG: T9SS type A sorting domain-containing protein [Bacteroidales bacterium]|nr:T9SS type A sorting domain-containing protein [Bacteroidales bacterium]MBN2758760.1 T9SS type A sorting domain-containing protein [Bacteroidales bacterium]